MLDFFFPLSQTKLWPYYTGTAYPSSCLSWVQGLLTLLSAHPGFRDCLPFFLPTLGSSPVFLVGSMFVIIWLLWLVFFASFVFVGVLCPMLPVSLDCPFCFRQRLFIGMWYSHINFCASTSHTINKSLCRKDHTLHKPDLIYIPQISATRGREESVCAIELQKPENHIN
jgi:hypothetical protein